jgi:hypothetical protein
MINGVFLSRLVWNKTDSRCFCVSFLRPCWCGNLGCRKWMSRFHPIDIDGLVLFPSGPVSAWWIPYFHFPLSAEALSQGDYCVWTKRRRKESLKTVSVESWMEALYFRQPQLFDRFVSIDLASSQ